MRENNRKKKQIIGTAVRIVLLAVLVAAALFTGRQKSAPEKEELRIYFLDVDEGDAIVITCGGRAMMIDGGPPGKSDTVYSFLKQHGIGELDYVVCTHPDEDHAGGLAGALNAAKAGKILCTVSEDESRAFTNLIKYAGKQGVKITVPTRGDRFSLGKAEIEILGPRKGEKPEGNTSLVLKLTFGATSFLFTGDAELPEERELLEDYGSGLKSSVLKVGHHGSASSTGTDFLKAAAPEYAVISVGSGNRYGHPAREVLDRLKASGSRLFRTDLQGTVTCTSDGETIMIEAERNLSADVYALSGSEEKTLKRNEAEKAEPETTESSAASDYILNTGSKKFHLPSCGSVSQISEKNREEFCGSRNDLLAEGYSPCGRCKP